MGTGRLWRILTDTERGHRRHGQERLGDALPTGTPGSGSSGPSASADTVGADERDPAAVRAFIEGFTSLLTQAGFPRTPARIFVALLTSDSSRLTAAELADLLRTSPASVSGGVRYLIQVGLVAAEGEPGSRRQHYRMPTDVWDEIVRLRNRQFARWVTELRGGVSALGADTPAGSRMAATVRYFDFLSTEMSGLLTRWQDLGRQQDARRRPLEGGAGAESAG
jgi:DNA-binding transcriptional regulator GbsR (MarR family)